MAKAFGIQVYDILPNGCLNGVYANEASNEVFNEIARKIDGNDDIIGKYDCFYFEINIAGFDGVRCDLEITAGSNSKYVFKWFEKNTRKTLFKGEGWKTSHNQITIQYRQ